MHSIEGQSSTMAFTLGDLVHRGMEGVMPLQHHQLGGALQDVGLAHHAAVIPPHLAGQCHLIGLTIGEDLPAPGCVIQHTAQGR